MSSDKIQVQCQLIVLHYEGRNLCMVDKPVNVVWQPEPCLRQGTGYMRLGTMFCSGITISSQIMDIYYYCVGTDRYMAVRIYGEYYGLEIDGDNDFNKYLQIVSEGQGNAFNLNECSFKDLKQSVSKK